jgi:hypothetical protein
MCEGLSHILSDNRPKRENRTASQGEQVKIDPYYSNPASAASFFFNPILLFVTSIDSIPHPLLPFFWQSLQSQSPLSNPVIVVVDAAALGRRQ